MSTPPLLPLAVGTKLSAYRVIESTPGRLVLKTSALLMSIFISIASLGVLFFAIALVDAFHPRNVTAHDPFSSWELGGLVVTIAVVCICISNLGRSLEIDAGTRSIRKRWLFVFDSIIPASQLGAVQIHIRNQPTAEDKATKQANVKPPPGRDEAVLTLQTSDAVELLEITRGALGTSEWPNIITAATQISQLLLIPMTVTGSPKFADTAAVALLTQFTAAIEHQ